MGRQPEPFFHGPIADGEAAADRYAAIRVHLESGGQPIGNMDMPIAASALAEGCRLVIRNPAHFGRAPSHPVEDWTA